MSNHPIVVSIVCTTYNHEQYIGQCLESLVSQKTTFPYEIIVHDDASTDATAEIIRGFAQRYPERIIPILQKENQCSQGVRISRLIERYIRGSYVASCEGDDYWCDPNKLQKQIDFLQNHPDYVACVANTEKLDCRDGSRKIMYPQHSDRDLTLEDVVVGGGAAYHTSTLVRRSEYYCLPDELKGKSFGDYNTAIYLALNGKIRYIKDVMSVYRYFAKGSYSSRVKAGGDERAERLNREACDMLRAFDAYSGYRYHEIFESTLRHYEVKRLYLIGSYREILRDRSLRKAYMQHNSVLRSLWLIALAYLPGGNYLRTIKARMCKGK